MALKYGCEQLCTREDVENIGDCKLESLDDTVVGLAIDAASDALINLSGRPLGRCTTALRPCRNACAPVPCGCCRLRGILLEGINPVVSQVRIDGAVVPPDTYTVLTRPSGQKYLERFKLDGTPDSWPGCQTLRLPATEEGTFEITYEHGEAIDLLMRHATAEIAADILAPYIVDSEDVVDDSVDRLSAYSMDLSMAQEIAGAQGRERDRLAGLGHVKRFLAAYPPLGTQSDVWAPELSDGWSHFVRG